MKSGASHDGGGLLLDLGQGGGAAESLAAADAGAAGHPCQSVSRCGQDTLLARLLLL